MKKNLIIFSFLLFLIGACNTEQGEEKVAENDLDAARSFIQAALQGKWDIASEYMLHDSANDGRMDAVSRIQRSSDEKQGLWNASINIHSRKLINDSTSIIIYSNSYYKENTDTLKVIKHGGKWLVDFKYLFDHE